MKVCTDWFPSGSFPYQKSAGYYMDPTEKRNLDILINAVGEDMQFVGIYCGRGTVRSGKSTKAQQDATYITHEVNNKYKVNNTFNIDNICFKADDLITKALKLPKYSVLILDEGDDLTENFWSHLAKKLRRFFRKCGQLNLFIFLILPDYFELPKRYAITISNYLVNVKFSGLFKRGNFEFYGFNSKKRLYLKGKKYQDYDVQTPDFEGKFPPLYTVNEKEYKEKKKRDLEEDESEPENLKLTIKRKQYEWLKKLYGNVSYLKVKDIAQALGISERTAYDWLEYKDYEELKNADLKNEVAPADYNTSIVNEKNYFDEVEEVSEDPINKEGVSP